MTTCSAKCAPFGVTSVAAAPSPDASTHLAFSTPYAQVVGTAVAAKQCLREALDAHNATGGGGGRQCSSWTNRPYARWRSPPWLASRLHQGRFMSAPRPNPSLRERVTPAMLHPLVRAVTCHHG